MSDDVILQAEGVTKLYPGTVALAGLDSYYRARQLKRMAYAQPGLPPRERD